jgi:serine/threonine protein kinase
MEHKDEGLPTTSLREIAVLKELDHEGIVKLIDILHGKDGCKLIMVFEYFNIDLRIYLDRKRMALPLENVKDIMSQVLQALLHCH